MVLLLVVIATPAAADDILIDCGVNNFLIKENFLGFKSLQWREEKQGEWQKLKGKIVNEQLVYWTEEGDKIQIDLFGNWNAIGRGRHRLYGNGEFEIWCTSQKVER